MEGKEIPPKYPVSPKQGAGLQQNMLQTVTNMWSAVKEEVLLEVVNVFWNIICGFYFVSRREKGWIYK